MNVFWKSATLVVCLCTKHSPLTVNTYCIIYTCIFISSYHTQFHVFSLLRSSPCTASSSHNLFSLIFPINIYIYIYRRHTSYTSSVLISCYSILSNVPNRTILLHASIYTWFYKNPSFSHKTLDVSLHFIHFSSSLFTSQQSPLFLLLFIPLTHYTRTGPIVIVLLFNI